MNALFEVFRVEGRCVYPFKFYGVSLSLVGARLVFYSPTGEERGRAQVLNATLNGCLELDKPIVTLVQGDTALFENLEGEEKLRRLRRGAQDMDARDFFAGCALAGLHYDGRDSNANRASRAYVQADAMLAEREKQP